MGLITEFQTPCASAQKLPGSEDLKLISLSWLYIVDIDMFIDSCVRLAVYTCDRVCMLKR